MSILCITKKLYIRTRCRAINTKSYFLTNTLFSIVLVSFMKRVEQRFLFGQEMWWSIMQQSTLQNIHREPTYVLLSQFTH